MEEEKHARMSSVAGARLAEFVQRALGSCDAICLQEFWFEPRWVALFTEALPDHTLVTASD